jgi:L-cysteine desulfidase
MILQKGFNVSMEKANIKYGTFVQILREELIPAMGCTEPIALAYAAAVARRTLGEMPDRVVVGVSGSIIKNVKSVIVPNTGHLKGIPAAVTAGIVAGKPEKELEVIGAVTQEQIMQMKEFMEGTEVRIEHIKSGFTFDIIVTLYKDSSYSKVRIANFHTNIVLIEKDGNILKQREALMEEQPLTDRGLLNMEDIWDFINTVDISDIKEILDRQIQYNWAIAEEGLRCSYGANIGKVLLSTSGNDVAVKAKAMAAAGSDARMNGCELPVIINSGSGNQGITVSVPVIVYAKERKVSAEKMYRALALSNLAAIHQKTPIGRLSAYCGAVNAGAGAGAGIAYLCGGGYKEVIHTMVNALAIISGIVCDGAKASCAAKIASSIDAGIFGYRMYMQGQQFLDGDGIVTKGVEATLKNVGRLGKEGMKETNEEIIKIMIGE